MTHGNGSSADGSRTAHNITTATDRGIRAARDHDVEEFTEAVTDAANHAEIVRGLHAQMVRELLETSYQDGLSSDDVTEVLTRTITGANQWNAPVNPSAVVVVLTGALGVGIDSETSDTAAPAMSSAEIIGAAFLVVADLAAAGKLDHTPYLARAVEEIRRAQTVEMP